MLDSFQKKIDIFISDFNDDCRKIREFSFTNQYLISRLVSKYIVVPVGLHISNNSRTFPIKRVAMETMKIGNRPV